MPKVPEFWCSFFCKHKITNFRELLFYYRKKFKQLHPEGMKIRSDKYPDLDGKILKGKQILEIPESNKSFNQIEDYKKIAKKYNIEIIFLKE